MLLDSLLVCSLQSRPVIDTVPPLPTSSLSTMPSPTDAPTGAGAVPGVAYPQRIKSFVRRAGRTTTGQTKALAELGEHFIVT